MIEHRCHSAVALDFAVLKDAISDGGSCGAKSECGFFVAVGRDASASEGNTLNGTVRHGEKFHVRVGRGVRYDNFGWVIGIANNLKRSRLDNAVRACELI